ncbi:hypothetical protein PInf_007603 [Phytophthora infestans]|nr:hypothetical protein PInf_007603 [Phytophthora infestans]
MLWCVLQDIRNFEDFAKNVDLIHARSSDPYVCMLVLFCMLYEHLLVVMDDEEMYGKSIRCLFARSTHCSESEACAS